MKQPGTQPSEVNAFVSPDNCQSCHGDTPNPDFEPIFGWRGSMMANSARDPLFWATLAVAEQDFLPDPLGASDEASAPVNRAWRPSPERVVWRWPHPDERLVEELS